MSKAQPAYGVSAESYLERAKTQLLTRTPEGLFYSAFELRCFVEARQDEYLDAQRKYAKSIPAAYHIGKQGKALEAIFASDRIQQIKWLMKGEDVVVFEASHVPVTASLRNGAERLGDLLHQQRKFRELDDPWWTETRADLVKLYQLAWTCRQGLLLSPVFMQRDGTMAGNVILKIDGPAAEAFAAQTHKGTVGWMHVDYLDAPPAEWLPDVTE